MTKKRKLRTLQGMILEQLLRRMAPFWSPFGSICVVLVLFGLDFELCTVPFRSLWLVFGSQISERTFWKPLSAKHLEKIPSTPDRKNPFLWHTFGTLFENIMKASLIPRHFHEFARLVTPLLKKVYFHKHPRVLLCSGNPFRKKPQNAKSTPTENTSSFVASLQGPGAEHLPLATSINI